MAALKTLISGIIKQGEKWVQNLDDNTIITSSEGQCVLCHQTFGLAARKYQCSICSINVCDSCSFNQFESDETNRLQVGHSQRLCDDCLIGCIFSSVDSKGKCNRISGNKLTWKIGESSIASDYSVELFFKLSSVNSLPDLLFSRCTLHSARDDFNDPTGASKQLCTCSTAKQDCALNWANEVFCASFDVRDPWCTYVTVELYSSNAASTAWHAGGEARISANLSSNTDINTGSHGTSNGYPHTSFGSNIDANYSSSNNNKDNNINNNKEMIGRCRIPLQDFYTPNCYISPNSDRSIRSGIYPLRGLKVPYYKSQCDSSFAVSISVVKTKTGDAVHEYKPQFHNTLIPYAVEWKFVDPRLSMQSMFKIPLINLFPPTSMLFNKLFIARQIYSSNKHPCDYCACQISLSSNVPVPQSSMGLQRLTLATGSTGEVDSLRVGKGQGSDEKKLVEVKIIHAMSNSMLERPSSIPSYDSTKNFLRSSSVCTCGLMNPRSVIPILEYLLHCIGSVQFSAGSPTGDALLPIGRGALLLTSHRLIHIPYMEAHRKNLAEDLSPAKPFILSICEIDTVSLKTRWRGSYHALDVTTSMDGILYRFTIERPAVAPQQATETDEIANGMTLKILRCLRDEIFWRKEEDQFAKDSDEKKYKLPSVPENNNRFPSSLNAIPTASTRQAPSKDPWLLDIRDEFSRLGVLNSDIWRVSMVNQSYSLCNSYPREIIVPADIDDEKLRLSANYRSSKRLPSLTWIHQNGAALFRSSQPCVGLMDIQCAADDRLLMSIKEAAVTSSLKNRRKTRISLDGSMDFRSYRSQSNSEPWLEVIPSSGVVVQGTVASDPLADFQASSHLNKTNDPTLPEASFRNNDPLRFERRDFVGSIGETVSAHDIRLRIVDARALLAAQGNAIMGKGFENVSRLGGAATTSIEFLGIENIHAMRVSYASMRLACCKNDTSYLLSVHESKWLQHLSDVLRGSIFVALQLQAGHPVLVHCSDGWDRTAQICCLSQILLDPYYRTIIGLKVLIEKDFLEFGHMFRYRSGLGVGGVNKEDASNVSPIFLQFLDALWQIWRQQPWEFEYSDQLLVALSLFHKTGFFDNFKYNNCFDRIRGAQGNTTYDENSSADLWKIVKEHIDQFLNPIYRLQCGHHHDISSVLGSQSFSPGSNESHEADCNIPEWLQEDIRQIPTPEWAHKGSRTLSGMNVKTESKCNDNLNCSIRLILPQTSISSLAVWEDVHFKGLPSIQGNSASKIKEKTLQSLLRAEEYRSKAMQAKIDVLKEQLQLTQIELEKVRKSANLRSELTGPDQGDDVATSSPPHGVSVGDWELLVANNIRTTVASRSNYGGETFQSACSGGSSDAGDMSDYIESV